MEVSLIIKAPSLDDAVRYTLEQIKGLRSVTKISAESYEWKFAEQFRIFLEMTLTSPVSAQRILSFFPKSFEKASIIVTDYEVEFIGTNQRTYDEDEVLALHEWTFLDVTLEKTEMDRIPEKGMVALTLT